MNRILISIAVSALIGGVAGGCSFAPKPEVAAAADYGRPASAPEMQRWADTHLSRALKDPESRRVEWGRSGKAWVWTGVVRGGLKYGYGLEALVNAKNSFGGYVGSRPYFFLFRDGVLIGADENRPANMYGFVP